MGDTFSFEPHGERAEIALNVLNVRRRCVRRPPPSGPPAHTPTRPLVHIEPRGSFDKYLHKHLLIDGSIADGRDHGKQDLRRVLVATIRGARTGPQRHAQTRAHSTNDIRRSPTPRQFHHQSRRDNAGRFAKTICGLWVNEATGRKVIVAHIVAQRTGYKIPRRGFVSGARGLESWFYKHHGRCADATQSRAAATRGGDPAGLRREQRRVRLARVSTRSSSKLPSGRHLSVNQCRRSHESVDLKAKAKLKRRSLT